ncbi:MAG: FixH family protein [Deltaproteobacteria bacterium]|nr:FixH family protein [Deltaproteobacteria bacterium]
MSPQPRPWYVQFWPWFLIALPAASVVFCVVCLFLAVRGADSLVRDDWYSSGANINRELGLDREAVRREISATLEVDRSGDLAVAVQGHGVDNESQLVLDLGHPTQAKRDLSLPLARSSDGSFHVQLPPGLAGAWYAVLTSPARNWRLRSRIKLPGVGQQHLVPAS